MSQSITLWGATFNDSPGVNLPKTGGGTALFTDCSPTTAVESDVASGKIFFKSDGSQATGSASGGGGSGMTLLATLSCGTLSTSSTSGTNTNKSISVTGYNAYDLLVVDVSVDSVVNNRHTSTVSFIILTGTSNVGTKNTYTVASNKWNSRVSSNGTASTRQNTTAYGIYANSASVSGSTMSIPLYYKYNNNNTGTINGTYTARVYGIKLYDIIGG